MTSEGDVSMHVSPSSAGLNLDKFRKLVKNYIERHHYQAAEFWANKLVSLSEGTPIDVYYLAQCYFLTKQYHRAVLLINSHNLARNDTCCYLAARCLYEIEEYKAALDLIEENSRSCNIDDKSNSQTLHIPEIDDQISTECSLQLLKGQIHEACDNRALASECFRNAFQADPLCYEALHALTHHHIMPRKEELSLLSSLPLSQSLNADEEVIVRVLYESQLSNYSGVSISPLPAIGNLQNNLDSLAAEAQSLYYQCRFRQCFKITQKLLQSDPYHPDCLIIHIACLVELNHTNALFLLGHKLVDLYPEDAKSWFAVGCYYYLIGKNESARRFLSKATTLDRVFGPAWIAYGHSFAAENEHDQARAAYYKAAQLIKGFTKAENSFRQAIESVEQSGLSLMPEKWATLLHNMGRTMAKLERYEEALDFHKHSLRVCPGDASSYACIGLCHAHCSRLQESIVALHKALALQRDNAVAANLLQTVINHVVSKESSFQGDGPPLLFDTLPLDSSLLVSQNVTAASNLDISIGDPDMHSSEVAGESAKNTPKSGDTSSHVIEDMIKKYLPGDPLMNLIEAVNESSTEPRTPNRGETSTLLIEDMIMDDDSP